MALARASIARAKNEVGAVDLRDPSLFLESLGVSDAEKKRALEIARAGENSIDPVVSVIIAATSGYAYKHLVGKLRTYPIPDLRLPAVDGKTLLDIGCNWGRWSVAAARKGYRVVGVDPSLGAIMAARRVARQLDVDIDYIVADARYLPFEDGTLDVFSYSVINTSVN
jgi:2-polyprenyl-3-methyl-5-hydroxy-6-metoxy-1,4-benzoquinol methylase